MAQRRMFSKSITNSSRFLMMPQSAQNLYFHLGMNADDDGFCEHFTIMRMTESKPDDLKILQVKGFIHIFDDKILIITEWKENNYIQKDRYSPSKYLKIYKNEIKQLSEGKSNVYKMDTQVRLGKVRLGKSILATPEGVAGSELNPLIELFKPINPSYELLFKNKTQRDSLERLVKKYGTEKTKRILETLPQIFGKLYAPRITTPIQLEQKLGDLISYLKERSQEKINFIDISKL